LTSELNEIIKMIDALMAGEFERCSSADLNRPLVGTDIEVLEKVSFSSKHFNTTRIKLIQSLNIFS